MPFTVLDNDVVTTYDFLYDASTTGSGTGNYLSFLRLAANGEEEGFNTDDNGEADNKDGIWTHSLLVGNLDTVVIDGKTYYQLRLDLNEIQSGDNPNITLEDLQIFRSAAPADGDDFDNGFPSSDFTKVFDLSGSLALVDTNHGSGTDDYVFLLPVEMFPDPTEYFTLYSKFSGSDDGFEEWRVLSTEFVPQPDIGILKETNDTDDECRDVLVGQTVTWTYTVENNGNLALGNVVVWDDNGTPLDDTDDFQATYVSGDTNGNSKLDTTETWTFTASKLAIAGEYMNTATVYGDWAFAEASGTVSGSEDDCYYGRTPAIEITKLTNGTDDLCPVLHVGDTVTWTYNVKNSGDIALSDPVVTDDNGTDGDTGDDFTPTEVLVGGYNVGDLNTDGIFDPGEIWQYTATGTAVLGNYENEASVAATATDGFGNTQEVTASEDDCYIAVEGPGVRTPGFWQNMNNGGQFWNGAIDAKNSGEDCFPVDDLLRKDSDHDGDIDENDTGYTTYNGKLGLFIGDYDRDGQQDAGEDILFISRTDAIALLSANTRAMNDMTVKVGRDVVASWLNYLAGNPIGNDPDATNYSPKEAINDAIDYLQTYAGKLNGGSNETWDCYNPNHTAVTTKANPTVFAAGAPIHSALDEYNNYGTVNDVGFAHTCEHDDFVSQMNGFSLNGTMFFM